MAPCVARLSYQVAPLAGAWIETSIKSRARSCSFVAPLAGAWIETPEQSPADPQGASLPSRERGSKPMHARYLRYRRQRRSPRGSVDRNRSSIWHDSSRAGRSPRGSVDRNPYDRSMVDAVRVAPLAGAWIETEMASTASRPLSVAPLAGAWIETGPQPRRRAHALVAPLAGAWIETGGGSSPDIRPSRRSPRGSVDRNGDMMNDGRMEAVAPLAGAWIETAT